METDWRCPLLARTGPAESASRCPFIGVDRKSRVEAVRAAVDPEGTWSECASVIQMEWRLHLVSLVSNVDLLFSQTAP